MPEKLHDICVFGFVKAEKVWYILLPVFEKTFYLEIATEFEP